MHSYVKVYFDKFDGCKAYLGGVPSNPFRAAKNPSGHAAVQKLPMGMPRDCRGSAVYFMWTCVFLAGAIFVDGFKGKKQNYFDTIGPL